MEKQYDVKNNRLVCIGDAAVESFWDKHWQEQLVEINQVKKKNKFIVSITKKYLAPGARVIDGGCGGGDKVYSLHMNGYDAYGIDYTQETVRLLNNYYPELKIFRQDCRKIEFEDGFFDGYWSLGVIEHYFNGYEVLIDEMRRVIRPSGILFLATPAISHLITFKARLGMYKKYIDVPEEKFYQFYIDHKRIKDDLEKKGFYHIEYIPYNAVDGIAEEIPITAPFLKWACEGGTIVKKIIYRTIDLLFSWYANYSGLSIFRKM